MAKTLPPQPAPPTGLRATSQTSNYLTMAWNPVSGAVGYRLMYSTKADMSLPFYRNIASGTTGGYGGLTPSTAYYVKVKALNSAGADLTAYSSAVIAKTLAAPPAPPAGLKSTAKSTTTLAFSWGAVPNAPQYRLALSSKADMTSASYATTTSAAGEMRGLSPATAYYAQVRVISATGAGITGLLPRCESNHCGGCRVAGNCQTPVSGVVQRALLHLQRRNAQGNVVGQPSRRGCSDHHF